MPEERSAWVGSDSVASGDPPQFRKSLGLLELVSLGVGGTIGSGIFVVPGVAAAVAGIYSLLAWAVVALSASCVVMSLAWLCGVGRGVGSFYRMYTDIFGQRTATFLIVLYLISSIFGISTIASGIGQYLGYFGHFPVLPIEIAIILIFCVLNLIGIYVSGITENVLTILKIIPLVAIAVGLVAFIRPGNFVAGIVPFNGHAILAAIILVYWPFTGFEISAIPVDETRDPNMISRSLFIVMAIVISIYLLLNISLIGSVGTHVLAASPAPIATAAGLFIPLSGPFVAAVGIIAMLSALNAYVVGTSRIAQQVSVTYQVPLVRDLSGRGTPAAALVLSSAVAAGTLFYSNHFDVLASLSVITNLIPYIFFCIAAALVFRKQLLRRIVAGAGALVTALILVLYFSF
jgi:amino acid transporter